MKHYFAVRVFSCCLALLVLMTTHPVLAQTRSAYRTTGLAADRPGANHTSPTLLNPWGIAFLPGGNFFIAENASGRVDSYDADGNLLAGVTIPAPQESSAPFSNPTGIVAIPDSVPAFGSSGFQFLVAADNGTIWGFTFANGVPQAATKFVDMSSTSARYTGLAVLSPDCCGTFLAVANFGQGNVDTFTRSGAPLSLSPLIQNPFVDPNLPAGYSPFNIQLIGTQVFVTYALKDGAGNPIEVDRSGIVNIFDQTGVFVKRFASDGDVVSAPWGVAQASANFGAFSNAILIGDGVGGVINAFDPATGNFLGQLTDGTGNDLFFVGLRGLAFRADGVGDPNTLYEVDGARLGQQPSGSFDAITPGKASFIGLQFSNTTNGTLLPGDPITVTAGVVASTGVPTGTVTFVDLCCTANPTFTRTTLGTISLVNGTASVVSTFASGDHVITASYSGDETFAPGSRSSTLDVAFATAITLMAPASAALGTPVVLNANVTSTPALQPALIPGQVTFSDGNVILGTAPVNNGTAQLVVSSLAAGAHSIAAAYRGNTSFLNSQSAVSTVTVENLAPDITSFAPTSAKQNSGAFTLTVNGSNFVNGAVVFFNGSARPTTFVSPTQVTAAIPASDLASSGTATLFVNNPPPGGGSSFRPFFAIDTATATSVLFDRNALTVTGGQSAAVNLQATGFTGAISTTCLNAPDGVICNFNPANNSLTIQTAAITPKGFHVITVVVNAQALASNRSTPVFLATTLGVFALPLGGVIIELRRRRKLKRAYWLVPILGCAFLLMAGCGGYGNSGSKQPNPTPQTRSAQASGIVALTVQ